MVETEMLATGLRQLGSWLLGVFFLSLAVPGSAEEALSQTPISLLQGMREAMERLTYQATVVYSRDNRIQTLKLFHQVHEGVVHERMQALNDSLREVVREADRVTCYLPDRKTMLVEFRQGKGSLFGHFPAQLTAKESIYRFRMGAKGRVAGRQAQEVVIEPLDRYRYGRRIWLDQDSNLPLKFELIDDRGNILEAIVVTNLKLGSESIEPFLASDHHHDWHVFESKVDPIQDRRWYLEFLPPGFSEVKRVQRLDPVDKKPIEHILVSDGIASVSLYIKEGSDEGFDPGNKRLGAVNVFSRRAGDFQITVLGDVPAETVKAIGMGLTVKQPIPAP